MALHDYPFLARPPPQKKRPVQPLPPLPVSPAPSTFAAIAAWASRVQPGSPLSRPSIRRGRRTSVSFLHIAPTPTTPSVLDFKADLTTVGYTSVFLQLPKTPISATLAPAAVPSPRKPRGLTRFRSLSALRRGRSTCATSPTVTKRKKATYARPPPLSNELALMQFVDGGSTDDNIKRLIQHADAFRDADGAVWWDHDEAYEYAHLLGDCDDAWVTFASSPAGEDRRVSVSTQDSDLDPAYVVHTDDAAFVPPRTPVQPAAKPNDRGRRRPTPLKLVPPGPASKLATNSPVDADRARRDFIEASFRPVVPADVRPCGKALGLKRNVMGLFRSRREEVAH